MVGLTICGNRCRRSIGSLLLGKYGLVVRWTTVSLWWSMLHCDMGWDRIFSDNGSTRFVTFGRTRDVLPI